MTYFIYTFTGAICHYFFCIYLLPDKLTFIKQLVVFSYTFIIFFLFGRIYGQASTFITFGGNILLIYFFTDNRYLSLSCYLFGYLYAITFNYLFLLLVGFIFKIDIEALITRNLLLIIFSCIYCMFCGTSLKLIAYYIHKKLNIAKYLTNRDLLKTIFVYLLLLVFFCIFNFSYGERLGYTHDVIALNGIIFLMLFLITVFLMYSVYKILSAK
ncbi:hypothetical protein Closa_1937 [[Clostridium] saccharolyticum WM1]|uniref:Uncharacterized protein n=1 Tax=Lacrimispora saccharolytica (strain ATCC 35040 / DSM 2544 / NRCC 2533 / WM1) TaxID=610130 RepID=D9R065_LACSW|nr:hypothetical protein Closa_1937 [[Clostridium] saccharolyticum WM1]